VGVFGLAPLGSYIQYYQERMGMPRSFTILAVVDAVMLIVTTSIAFLFAYKRKIAQHRQWMTRSYAVALVFISGRFVAGVTGWDFASIETQQAIIWSCLALSILLADLANNWMELRGVVSATVKTTSPVPQNLRDPAIETI